MRLLFPLVNDTPSSFLHPLLQHKDMIVGAFCSHCFTLRQHGSCLTSSPFFTSFQEAVGDDPQSGCCSADSIPLAEDKRDESASNIQTPFDAGAGFLGGRQEG